ncbi:MAG TPA: zinc-ribbon domain-containing protein [bacterium]|nr:zinc-ribbon domain-containing protein [bacterium]
MIVQCDKCGAKFHLADEKVTDKGAKVRCSKCKAVFTVKKSKEQPDSAPAPAPEALSPKTAPAPSAPAPAPPAAPRKAGDDPFSDFNFSDDLDFSEGEDKLTVEAPPKPAPPPPAPEPGFSAAPVPAKKPAPPPPAAEEAAGSDEAFDFSDEDFSLSDEPKAAAGPEPAVEDFGAVDLSSQAPPPPAPPPAKGGPDDFGDFKFDDDSFSEKAAPPPAPPTKGDGEWGNISFTEQPAAPPKADARGGGEIEEAGFGDFQFDQNDHLPAAGGGDEGMPAEDFVRSPTSRAPVRDDFEASIGDSEAEPERKEEVKAAPPPPPKPVIKTEPRKGAKKGLATPIIIAIIVLAVPLGLIGYMNSNGWFTFDDLLHFRMAKLGPAIQEIKIAWGLAERPDTGIVEYLEGSAEVKQPVRPDGQSEIAVSGKVINNTRKTVLWIQTEVSLKDQNDQTVETARSYCDVSFTEDELKNLSSKDILTFTDYFGGRTQKCIDIKPGETRTFTVVFFPEISEGVKLTLSKPRVVDCKVLEDNTAPCPLTPPAETSP